MHPTGIMEYEEGQGYHLSVVIHNLEGVLIGLAQLQEEPLQHQCWVTKAGNGQLSLKIPADRSMWDSLNGTLGAIHI